MKYLITGATGDVGGKVTELLLQRGERPAVYVRDAAKARARFGDSIEVRTGDLGDAQSLSTALEGVDSLFLVNSGPRIPVWDEIAAKAAAHAGVQHLVKLSSMDVEHGLAIGAWHELGEEAIQNSGVPFTFVQPTGFMSNLLAWAYSIKAEGVVRSSTGAGRRAFIHSDDIAAVCAEVLLSRRYLGESLPITGPQALSFAEVTAKIGDTIGKPLRYETISDEEARKRYAAATGDPFEIVEAHVALWRAIREGRLAVITEGVEHITGRKPRTLDQWLTENAASFLS